MHAVEANGCPPSADLLCEHDDDALRAADVAAPLRVLVILDPAKDFRAAGLQPGDGGVDVIDWEGDMGYPEGVRRRVPVAVPGRRGVEFHEFESSMAVRGLQHRDGHPDALKPHHPVHPAALDRSLSQHFESEVDEELRRGGETVENNAQVFKR